MSFQLDCIGEPKDGEPQKTSAVVYTNKKQITQKLTAESEHQDQAGVYNTLDTKLDDTTYYTA